MLLKPIDLAIVDDHSLFRKTLRNFLSEQKNFHVAVQASDVFELLSKLAMTHVDVLLMDVFLPDVSGSDALHLLRSNFPEIRVLILSMSTDKNIIGKLLEAGAHGYVSKGDEPDELLQAIYTVADKRVYSHRLFPDAAGEDRSAGGPLLPGNGTSLNDRERRLIQLIWEEKSNKQIADELFLGVRSVEKIRQDIKGKVGVKSTVGLLKYAINQRIVGMGAKSIF